jgi:hypothetical protein
MIPPSLNTATTPLARHDQHLSPRNVNINNNDHSLSQLPKYSTSQVGLSNASSGYKVNVQENEGGTTIGTTPSITVTSLTNQDNQAIDKKETHDYPHHANSKIIAANSLNNIAFTEYRPISSWPFRELVYLGVKMHPLFLHFLDQPIMEKEYVLASTRRGIQMRRNFFILGSIS